MIARCSRMLRRAFTLVLAGLVAAQPAAAQSILRDAETEALFNDMARPLIEAAGMSPRNVRVVLVNDPSINAFVTAGQNVYLHSGLVMAADDINQVEGVVAHEIGHITGGHAMRSAEGAKTATAITLLSMLLGAAAMAAGGGDAGMGIMSAGQRAAIGSYLAFNRSQESSADAAGATFLSTAGISGKGSIAFFKKLQNQELRLAIPQTNGYERTHPLSGDRISALEADYRKDKAWNRPTDPSLEARFQRVRAKLIGYATDKDLVLARYPEHDRSVGAHYARAYAWHRKAFPEKALAEADALLATAPDDPYFLELKGQILLESGRAAEAVPVLRRAVAGAANQPLIASLLSHALIATEQRENLAEAKALLKTAVNRDNDNPFAWYQLGIIYDREGDAPRAALASAERFNLEGNPRLALASAQAALRGIPAGTPDYLRAQDISLVSRAAVDKDKRGGRDEERPRG